MAAEQNQAVKASPETSKSVLGFTRIGKSFTTEDTVTAVSDVLGLIYRLMLRVQEDEKLHGEEQQSYWKKLEEEEQKRNDELIKAFTGLKKKRKKVPKEKKETQEVEHPENQIPTKTQTAPRYRDERGRFVKKPTQVIKSNAPTGTTTTASGAGRGTQILTGVAAGGILLGSTSEVIAKEEGVATKGYWDPPNQRNLVSIGFGHQIQNEEYKQGFIQAGDEQIPIKGDKGIDTTLTKDQAKKLLAVDLPKYEKRAASPLGDSWNKLNENQKTALISYTYNTGSTQSLVRAGLKEAIDSGDMKLAANIIREKGIKTAGGQYNKVLDERRHREAALFETGVGPKQQKVSNVPASPITGDRVDSSSKENKELRSSAEKSNETPSIISKNTTTQTTSQSFTQSSSVDDSPAIIKKMKS
jgi:GH24 family phage-related lysozyme (muramidase)